MQERGDNIQEGHFAERSWGPLLATPLQTFQIKALRQHSTGVRMDHFAIHGALIKAATKPSITRSFTSRDRGRPAADKTRSNVRTDVANLK